MDLEAILSRWWEALLGRLPRRAAFVLRLFQQTGSSFIRHEGPSRAATIAYYAFFSAFPLALFVIACSSYLLESQVTQQQIYTYFETYIPQVSAVVRENIEQVISARGAVSLVALVTLLWSASGVFSAVAQAINRAWGIERPRPFWKEKALALGMVLVVSVLFLLSFLASTALSMVNLLFSRLGIMPDQLFWITVYAVLPTSFLFVLLALTYRLMPPAGTRVRWRVVLPGAALAAIAWELAKDGFSFYLAYFARYDLVYGQVGVFIILLLYFYFVGAVLLLGAEFTATFERLLKDESTKPLGPAVARPT